LERTDGIMSFAERLVASWYAPGLTVLAAVLLPLSLLFRLAVTVRRRAYRARLLHTAALPVPVVVVGSIVIGGVGKTPLTKALAEALAARGWRPGIVSRGYGGVNAAPRIVHRADDPALVGDEPLLLAHSGLPVWIGRDRAAAARSLLARHPECDVLLSDDGLQHYALSRDFEIAVIDAARGLGNGYLLPAGPLREPASRLREVDAVVTLVAATGLQPARNGGRESVMWYDPLPWRSVADPDAVADTASWRAGSVHALAGIGDPRRFFDLVRGLGFDPVCHAFPDHHRYVRADLEFPGAIAILMTEKDAVKCAVFADARCWYLPIRARIDPVLIERVEGKLRGRQAA
jgi:tetraacyldisaccharide 4'-kinase